jgi:hypothetical protein
MISLDHNPPDFVSRAVGVVAGRLRPDPVNGVQAVILTTEDGTEIPGVIQKQAAKKIMDNPALMVETLECLAYPRTERRLLKLIIVDLEPTELSTWNKDRDIFLIQGMNIGSRLNNVVQLAIRPNRNSTNQFERFWICLNGHLTDDQRVVYKVKALRKGRKLFIVESAPQVQKRCSPHRKQKDSPPRERARTIIRRG